jgi:hypothetical protein
MEELRDVEAAAKWVDAAVLSEISKDESGKVDAGAAWSATPPETRERVIRGLEVIFGHDYHREDPVPILTLVMQWRVWRLLIFYLLPVIFHGCVSFGKGAVLVARIGPRTMKMLTPLLPY